MTGDSMTPDELRPIVTAWGGVEAFAAILHAKPRTVYSWLDGTRKIRPTVAAFIRSLSPPAPRITGQIDERNAP